MLRYLVHTFLILFSLPFFAQEGVKPLTANINYLYGDLKPKPRKQTNIVEQNKTTASLSLPFIDDFSYSPYQAYPDQNLWSDSSTYVNSGFAIAPPSIGVATFDGLNKFGYPYTPFLGNLTVSLPADFLTSKPINLNSLPADSSVALTFYYQAKGNGESPEITDSLLLDFYGPKDSTWTTVWYQRGNSSPNTNDTIFKRGFAPITDTAYLHDGFKFRFRNKATTVGDFDHWNLDYVYLNKNRINAVVADTAYNDFAIGYIPSPLLRNYAAMPWRQYDTSELARHYSVFIRNNSTAASNIGYANNFYNNTNTFTQLGTYVGGQALSGYFNHFGWINHAAVSNPPNTYTFAPFTGFADYTIKHYLVSTSTLTAGDYIPANDTVLQHQDFNNYYAYDDGSAEGGYYILGFGGKMAAKFTTHVTDTLRSVKIYFDPPGDFNLAKDYTFRITIWNATSNGIPSTVYYSDTLDQTVAFHDSCGFNCFTDYPLNTVLVLPPGSYFIGMQQKVASGIVVGFDKNLNHSSNLYYDSGNGWTQSQIYGSLMLRPVFGAPPPTTGIKENATNKNNLFSVYPNPSSGQFIIHSQHTEKSSYTLINAIGQKVGEGKIENQQQTVNTENLSNGIYFLILKVNEQLVQQNKIIIQH